MKNLLVLFILFMAISQSNAQTTNSKPEHKIILQLSSGDTTAHKALMKQIDHILSVSPTTKIEVVCHGPGLFLLVASQTIVAEKIKAYSIQGVQFMACEFSMKERYVEKNQILDAAFFVKAGIIEIVSKQELGWSYIKAGF